MNIPKVSIIIPVYNVSPFLRKCLDSVVNQELKEIEIIIVNDASPDPLDEEICLEYVKKDNRIIYTKHERNKGLGEARNTGMSFAKGEYIGFVDSDDSIHQDMYQDMYTQAKEGEFDMVQCRITCVRSQNEDTCVQVPLSKSHEKLKLKNTNNILKSFFRGFISPQVYSKLFRRDLLFDNDILFLPIIYEDTPFTFHVISNCSKLLLIDKNYYYYLVSSNPNSIVMQKIDEFRVKSLFTVFDEMNKIMTQKNLQKFFHKNFLLFALSISLERYNSIKDFNVRWFFFKEMKKHITFKKNPRLLLVMYFHCFAKETKVWSMLKLLKIENRGYYRLISKKYLIF